MVQASASLEVADRQFADGVVAVVGVEVDGGAGAVGDERVVAPVGLVRQGIARLLTDEGVDVNSAVDNADDLVRRVAVDAPDVAIVDVRMPPTHTDEGLVAAQRIRRQHPATGVLVLSQHVEAVFALELLRSGGGGTGYLLKDRVLDSSELAEAVRRVAAGETVVDRQLVHDLMTSSGRLRPSPAVGARARPCRPGSGIALTP